MLLTSITSAIMVTFFITWLFVKFVDFYLNIRLSSAICSLVLRHNTPVKFLNGVVSYNNFRIIFPIPLLYRALSSVCFWYLEAWLAGQRKQGSEDCREERHRWEGETHAKSGKWFSKRIMGRQLSPIVGTLKKWKKQYWLSFTTIPPQQGTPSIVVTHQEIVV